MCIDNVSLSSLNIKENDTNYIYKILKKKKKKWIKYSITFKNHRNLG